MLRRLLLIALFALPLAGSGFGVSEARACPMCKEANENEVDEAAKARPKAYMYSILFMLSMPVMVFSGFGVAFYRVVQKANREQELAELAASEEATSGEAADGMVPEADGDHGDRI